MTFRDRIARAALALFAEENDVDEAGAETSPVSTERAPLKDPREGYSFATSGGLYEADKVVLAKSWAIYDDMLRKDPRIARYVTFLKDALLSGGADVVAVNENPDAEEKKRIEFLKWNMENIRGSWLGGVRNVMGAYEYGVSINEMVFELVEDGPWKGKIALRALKEKHPQHFRFDQDVYGNLLADGLVQFWQNGELRHPVEKFVVYSHEERFSNKWGRSLLEAVYPAFFARQFIPKMAHISIEKTGAGVVIVKVAKGTPKDVKARIIALLRRAHGACEYVFEEDQSVEVMPFNASGFEAMLKMLDYHTNEVAVGLGIPLLFFSIGPSGSYALAKEQREVALTFYAAQQDAVDDVLTETVFTILCEMNFGPGPVPRHKLRPISMGTLDTFLQQCKALGIAGAKPTIEYTTRELGIPAEAVEDKPEPQPFGGGASFAERELSRAERRIRFSELVEEHERAAISGTAALRAAIAKETKRIQAKIAEESGDARSPLASTRSSESSNRTRGHCEH